MFSFNKTIAVSLDTETTSVLDDSISFFNTIHSSFDREIRFVKKDVQILEPKKSATNKRDSDSRRFYDSVYFPLPPLVPPSASFIDFQKRERKGEIAKFQLSMLLPCAYPFPISVNELRRLDVFMNSFWKYNQFTAKGTRTESAISEINKMITNHLFNESKSIDDRKLAETPSGKALSGNELVALKKKTQKLALAIQEGIESAYGHPVFNQSIQVPSLLKWPFDTLKYISKEFLGYSIVTHTAQDAFSESSLRWFIEDFFNGCITEKEAGQTDLFNYKSRKGSVAGKVMISGMSLILGIDENSFEYNNISKGQFKYSPTIIQHLKNLMDYMDNVCIYFNEEISINKEYLTEDIDLPWEEGGFEEWRYQLRKSTYNNLYEFYKELKNLKEAIKKEFLDSELNTDKVLKLKWYVLIIEGVMYGVQWWSSFVTNRYNSSYETYDPIDLYNHLMNQQSIDLDAFLKMKSEFSSQNLILQIKHIENQSREAFNEDGIIQQGFKLYVDHQCYTKPTLQEQYGVSLKDEVKEFLESDEEKILLIQGNTGSGKSLFLRKLEQDIWQQYNDNNAVIPIYIPLFKYNKGNFINEILSNYGFTEATIRELREKRTVIFLMDGYDEALFNNIYQINELDKWPTSKVIITCRTQFLNGQSYHARFVEQTWSGNPKRAQLRKTFILPFNRGQVDNLIQNYIEYEESNETSNGTSTNGKNFEWYISKLRQFDFFQESLNDPLILRMLLDILSGADLNESFSQKSRGRIYADFMKQWFLKEYNRKLLNKPLDELKSLKIFENYAQSIAFELFSRDELVIIRGSNKWNPFFIDDDEQKTENLSIGFDGCPLRKIKTLNESGSGDEFIFIHKSFQEYFAVQKLIKSLLNNNGPIDLNKKLLVYESGMVSFFVDELVNHQEASQIQKQLFDFIEMSKENPSLSIAAANAITLLNTARISLSAMDLKNAQIQNANLECALLNFSDLSAANLDGVNFRGAQLTHANLINASMNNVYFGERPHFQLNGYGHDMAYLKSEDILATIDHKGTVIFWHTSTHEKIATISMSIEIVDNQKPDFKCEFIDTAQALLVWSKSGHMFYIRINQLAEGLISCFSTYQQHGIQALTLSQNYMAIISTSNQMQLFRLNSDFNEDPLLPNPIQLAKEKTIISSAFNNQETELALGLENGSVIIFTLEGVIAKEYHPHKNYVNELTYTNDGTYLITASGDQSVQIWNRHTMQREKILNNHTSWVNCLQISPDNKCLATSGKDAKVSISNLESGKQQLSILGHKHSIKTLRFIDDNQLLSLGNDKQVMLWETGNFQILKSEGHKRMVERLFVSNNGETLFSVGHDKQIIYSTSDVSQTIYDAVSQLTDVRSINMSLDTSQIVIGKKHGQVTIIDANTKNNLCDIQIGNTLAELCEKSVYSVVFSECKRYLAMGINIDDPSEKTLQRVLVYRIDPNTNEASLNKDFSSFNITKNGNIAFGNISNQCLIALGDNQGRVTITNLTTGINVTTNYNTKLNEISLLSFDERSKELIVSYKNIINVYSFNLDGGPLIKHKEYKLPVSQEVSAMTSFKESGLLLGKKSGEIQLIDVESDTLQSQFEFSAHTDAVTTLAVHPSKDIIFSGSRDSTVKYWDKISSGDFKLTRIIGNTSLNIKGAKIDNISASQEIKSLLVQSGAVLDSSDQNI